MQEYVYYVKYSTTRVNNHPDSKAPRINVD